SRKPFSALCDAANQLGEGVPAEARQVLEDWLLLGQHFRRSVESRKNLEERLHAACMRRGLRPTDLLRRYFETFVAPRGDEVQRLYDFLGKFQDFYPGKPGSAEAKTALEAWLAVVRDRPDEDDIRAAFQSWYFDKAVKKSERSQLAQEFASRGLLPSVV